MRNCSRQSVIRSDHTCQMHRDSIRKSSMFVIIILLSITGIFHLPSDAVGTPGSKSIGRSTGRFIVDGDVVTYFFLDHVPIPTVKTSSPFCHRWGTSPVCIHTLIFQSSGRFRLEPEASLSTVPAFSLFNLIENATHNSKPCSNERFYCYFALPPQHLHLLPTRTSSVLHLAVVISPRRKK